MASEIFLRIANRKYLELQLKIQSLLRCSYKVHLIDDSDMNSKFERVFRDYDHVVSLSRDIKDPQNGKTEFQYFKISRVFDVTGMQRGWLIPAVSQHLISQHHPGYAVTGETRICVIDSDVASGATRQKIKKFFPQADFFAPLVLESHQDLIDIEDLFEDRSYIFHANAIRKVNYLLNFDFFKARTSLDGEAYSKLRNLALESVAIVLD